MELMVFLFSILAVFGGIRVVGKMVLSFSEITKQAATCLGLFFLNKFAVPAMQSAQTVIKERSAKVTKTEAVFGPEVTQILTQPIARPEIDWDYLEIPAYLRNGKELVW